MKHKEDHICSSISPYTETKSLRTCIKKRSSLLRRSYERRMTRLRAMLTRKHQLCQIVKRLKSSKSCASENRLQSAVSTPIENIMRKGSANSAMAVKASQPLLQHVNTKISLLTPEICAVSAISNGITDSRGKQIKR